MKDYEEYPVVARIEVDVVDWRKKGHRIAVDVTTHIPAFDEQLPLAARVRWMSGDVQEFVARDGQIYASVNRVTRAGRPLSEDGLRLLPEAVIRIGGTPPLPPKHTVTGCRIENVIQAEGWSIGSIGRKYNIDDAKKRVAYLQDRLRDRIVISDGMLYRKSLLPEYMIGDVNKGDILLIPRDHPTFAWHGLGFDRSFNAGMDFFPASSLEAAQRYCRRFGRSQQTSVSGDVLYCDPAHQAYGRADLCRRILSWCQNTNSPIDSPRHWTQVASAAKAACEGGDPEIGLSLIAGELDDAIFEGVVERVEMVDAILSRIVDAEGIRPYRPTAPCNPPAAPSPRP